MTPAKPNRDLMPERTCAGYSGRRCTTILSVWNPDSICSLCSDRRARDLYVARRKGDAGVGS